MKWVTIENYKSLNCARKVPLSKINLLIGKNNCGKSSFTSIVKFLHSSKGPVDFIRTNQFREQLFTKLLFNPNKKIQITYPSIVDDTTVKTTFEIDPSYRAINPNWEFFWKGKLLGGYHNELDPNYFAPARNKVFLNPKNVQEYLQFRGFMEKDTPVYDYDTLHILSGDTPFYKDKEINNESDVRQFIENYLEVPGYLQTFNDYIGEDYYQLFIDKYLNGSNQSCFDRERKTSKVEAQLVLFGIYLLHMNLLQRQDMVSFSTYSFDLSQDIYDNKSSLQNLILKELDRKILYQKVGKRVKEGEQKFIWAEEEAKFIKKWLRELGITKEVKVEYSNWNDSAAVYFKSGKDWELASSYGRGYVHILCLLTVLSMKYDTIYLEEPETGLHPNLQSVIPDIITDQLEKFKKQVFIETHSEYILRKFQLLVAQGKLDAEDINVLYFEKSGKETKIYKINILEDGALDKPLGSGFLDESTNLMLNLMQQQNSKS